jgi:hypothetical protein
VREPKSEADLWRHFHERFQSLADEEVEKEAARRDRFLRAHFTYRKETEIFHVRDARWTLALFYRDLDVPETARVHTATNPLGPFCLLEPPQSGLWTFSDGVNENLRERLQTLAARAAITLDCTKGTDPVDFWLHRLLHDLRENQSKLLFGDDGEAGLIVRVCEASAIFCARLERNALEAAVLPPQHDTERGKPERIRRKVVKRRAVGEGKPKVWTKLERRGDFIVLAEPSYDTTTQIRHDYSLLKWNVR